MRALLEHGTRVNARSLLENAPRILAAGNLGQPAIVPGDAMANPTTFVFVEPLVFVHQPRASLPEGGAGGGRLTVR
jgi:hypothetical protein